MKKILVKYTLEIPEDRFNKACFKAMIGNRELTFKLRDMAEVHGRTEVYNWIDNITGKKKWTQKKKEKTLDVSVGNFGESICSKQIKLAIDVKLQ